MVEEAGHHSSKWPKKPRPQGSVETAAAAAYEGGLEGSPLPQQSQ